MLRIILLAATVAFALPTLLASAALPQSAAVSRGVQYIRATQQPDGGFGGFGDGQTFDAVFAIRASGVNPVTIRNGDKSPADFLREKAAAQTSAGSAAKAAMSAIAMEIDPRDVAGTNLIARITAGFNGTTYAGDAFSHATAMIALTAAGEPVPAGARAGLLAMQESDGGWGFGGFSDPDTTALAIQALAETGGAIPENSLAYLHAQQLADGGWGLGESNANSTAFVVQAILALGMDPEGPEWSKGTATPVSYLVSQQQADGSFAGFDPGFATNQAVPALAGRTFLNAITTPAVGGVAPSQPTPGTGPVEQPSPVVTATPTSTPRPATPTAVPATPTATATAVASATPASATPASATPVAVTATPVRPANTPAAPQAGTGAGPRGGGSVDVLPFAGVSLLVMAAALAFAARKR